MKNDKKPDPRVNPYIKPMKKHNWDSLMKTAKSQKSSNKQKARNAGELNRGVMKPQKPPTGSRRKAPPDLKKLRKNAKDDMDKIE